MASARSAAGRTTPYPNLSTPTSVPRANLSSCAAAKAVAASTFPTAASGMQQPELVLEGFADLAPLLELSDLGDATSTTVLSASAADATKATANSTVTQVGAPADTTDVDAEGPVPLTEIEQVLTELRGARGLSPRSKRLLAALAETAYAELILSDETTAAALRMRRVAFWRKVRVGILPEAAYGEPSLSDNPTAASGMQQPELIPEGLADFVPLLELPDPCSSSTILSASAADATNATADSTVTQVGAPADTTAVDAEGPVPLTEIEQVLTELRGVRVLSPRSKRLLAELILSDETTAAALSMLRVAFWRKVRVGIYVGILAATVVMGHYVFYLAEDPRNDPLGFPVPA